MSIQTYSVDRFIGLNQSGDENLMSPACTPDAANMCTDGGELRVAYGFTRLFEAAVPGTLRIDFFTLYRTNGAEIPVVIAGGVVYAYIENAWTPVYTYQSTRSKPIYDCAQVRINTTDYLVIADGQHGMIKFDGSSVTQFGSEENASNISIKACCCDVSCQSSGITTEHSRFVSDDVQRKTVCGRRCGQSGQAVLLRSSGQRTHR